MNEKTIHLNHISYKYHEQHIITDLSHEFRSKQRTSIIGKNGSGKTTLLHLIAWLKHPYQGNINKKESTIGYVFQDYRNSLFPRKTVYDNIRYPLHLQWATSKEQEQKVNLLLQACPLEIPLNHYPYQLSWWQQQLINIMRSLILSPDFLLLDEPFSSLDHVIKEQLHNYLHKIFENKQLGIIMVSHDLQEAKKLSNIIYTIQDGKLKEITANINF